MKRHSLKISIIIPVYDSSEFLRRVLDSCLYQTLSGIEVIAVNDCSPNPRDREIMEEYVRSFPSKFRAVYHEVNKRQGGSRNTGIKMAAGEYVLCVDHDDWLDRDMCEKMYAKAKEQESDICVCGYREHRFGEVIEYPPAIFTPKNFDRFSPAVWKILIKKQFIVDEQAWFPEKTTADDVISLLWFSLTEKYCLINDCFYNWMRHERAISTVVPFSFLASVPLSFIDICERPSFIALPERRRINFSLFMSNHLYSALILCLNKHADRIKELMRLVRRAMEICSPDLNNRLFTCSTYSGLVKNVLQYVLNCAWLNYDENVIIEALQTFRDKYTTSLIQQKILDIVKPRETVTIWGAGVRGKRLARCLNNIGIPFSITDINVERTGDLVEGVPIADWKKLKNGTDVVIVSALGAYNAVVRTINNERIRIVDMRDLETL